MVNNAAVRFYKRAGFEICALKKNYPEGYESYRMVKKLPIDAAATVGVGAGAETATAAGEAGEGFAARTNSSLPLSTAYILLWHKSCQ